MKAKFIFFTLLAGQLAAQTFIKGGFNFPAGISYPEIKVASTSNLFFVVNDGINGSELWKSDGTAAGTMLVKDITPGPAGTTFGDAEWTVFNNELYFVVDNTTFGRELWKSDGTAAGTFMLKDINPGTGGSSPASGGSPGENNLVVSGNKLFFRAYEPTNGNELWCTDGTAAGTILLADINPGSNHSFPVRLCDVNGVLYFCAIDSGTHGEELWRSDGTAAGTYMVKDIYAGSMSSNPTNMTNVNGHLFFFAEDATNGSELWKSDGTAGGTVLIKDIKPGQYGCLPNNNNTFKGKNRRAIGSTLFFYANDGAHGSELWKSDGTFAGTTLVKDINPGTADSEAYITSQLTDMNNQLVFIANEPVAGKELWISDGTAAGTTLISDIIPGTSNCNPNEVTAMGNKVFFTGNFSSYSTGLYSTDGTGSGTFLIFSYSATTSVALTPRGLISFNGNLYFMGDDGTDKGLWKAGSPVPTSVIETRKDYSLQLYPNPASDQIKITIPAEEEVNICNTLGEIVLTKHLHTGLNDLDITEFKPGIYFITNGIETAKFVKQ